MQISRLVVGLEALKSAALRPGRNFKPITFRRIADWVNNPPAAGNKGCLMSCRQSSPPEAPDGQKYIPWCLPAFVLEKPLRAPLVPFWRQLPRQVREGGSPTEEGLPSPLAVRKQSAEGQEKEVNLTLSSA